MEIILNDIALKYKFDNKYVAIEKIKESIEILNCLRRQDNTFKLFSEGKITVTEIAQDYYFSQLFSEKDDLLERNYKTSLKTFFVNFNKVTPSDGIFFFEEFSSSQCGYAFEKNKLVFSIVTKTDFSKDTIEGTYISDTKQYEKAILCNIAQKDHLDVYAEDLERRIYDPNPKHKINYGWGSIMDLDDNIAQRVLDKAIVAQNDSKHLIALYRGKYYSFRCHARNYYHGYEDASMPESMKYKLSEIALDT